MIKFVSVFNSDMATAVNKHNVKKTWWVFVLFGLICVGIGIAILLSEENGLVGGVFFIAFGALFPVFVFVGAGRNAGKKQNYPTTMSDETTQTIIFDEDKVTFVENKGEDFHSETTAKYNYFYRVDETATHYFLYISKIQMHVCPKKDLVEGSLEDLNAIFEYNLGEKFKRKK